MTLKLTPEVLRAAYAYLHETEPFCRWDLPDAEDVRFVVTRNKKNAAAHRLFGGQHEIEVSERWVGHTGTLFAFMAHEMIHAHELCSGVSRNDVLHGRLFRKLSVQVCRIHGFDPKWFI